MIPETSSYILLSNGSDFACRVLSMLLQSNCPPAAIVRSGFSPAPKADNAFIQQVSPDRFNDLIDGTGIDVFYQSKGQETLPVSLQTASIDYILVVCYPWNVNAQIRSLAKRQAINLHPSLLPAYRGPDPVFWQLKNAEIYTGISLHEMNDKLDEGTIISQVRVDFSTFDDRAHLDEVLARAGAGMFLNVIHGNELQTVDVSLPASYYGFPQTEHFQIDLCKTAQQIYSFFTKTDNMHQVHWINLNGIQRKVRRIYLEKHLQQPASQFLKKGVHRQATESGDIYLEFDN